MESNQVVGALPQYDSPPLVETVLGVQFERIQGLTNAHLGAFWSSLDRRDWPTVSDATLIPTRKELLEPERSSWRPTVSDELRLTRNPAARIQITNGSGDRMIQVQANRLHLNWISRAKDDYPRHDQVRVEFLRHFEEFVRFVEGSKLRRPMLNQWEITYVNVIPRGTMWNSPADWTFFEPLRGVPSFDGVIGGESFGGEWQFVLAETRGRLHVKWEHARQVESDREYVQLDFTARGPLEAMADIASIDSTIQAGRRAIVLAFRNLMSKSANEYWGMRP